MVDREERNSLESRDHRRVVWVTSGAVVFSIAIIAAVSFGVDANLRSKLVQQGAIDTGSRGQPVSIPFDPEIQIAIDPDRESVKVVSVPSGESFSIAIDDRRFRTGMRPLNEVAPPPNGGWRLSTEDTSLGPGGRMIAPSGSQLFVWSAPMTSNVHGEIHLVFQDQPLDDQKPRTLAVTIQIP